MAISILLLQEDHIKLARQVKAVEADQDRQDNNINGLEVSVRALRNDVTTLEGRTEEKIAILHKADRDMDEKYEGLFAETKALREEIAAFRLRKWVRPEEFQGIIERYDAEFRRLELLASKRDDPTIHISATVTEHMKGLRVDIDDIGRKLREEMDALRILIGNGKADSDGRFSGLFGRLEVLEADLSKVLRNQDLSKVLAEIDIFRRDITDTKGGLSGLLGKLEVLERDIHENRSNIGMNRGSIRDGDERTSRLSHKIDVTEEKWDKITQDIWRDQKRQDEMLGILRADLESTSKGLSVLSVDIKGVGDNTALAQRVSNLQDEVTRQARVDLDLKHKIELVDDRSLKNQEKIILLEEQNQIHISQANYVQSINTKMVELEKKQTSDVWDADIKEHRGAISILQDDMRKLLSRIEGHDGEFVLVRKDLAGFNYLKDEVRNIWESQRRQDHDIGTMEDRLKRLDINENQLKELQANLQGLLAVHSRIESLVDGQQRHDRSIVDILKQLKRMDSIDGELNNLRVSIRDLLTLKVNIEALVDQQRKIEGAFELLTADVRKKLKDWGISLEDYEERSRKLSDRLGLDINEMRGLLEVIEKRISDNRTDIKDLDAKFDLNFQKNLDIFIRNFKGGDFKELMDLVENKLYEVDRQSQKNKGHVEKLRELNSKLMVEIPSQVNKELQVLRTELSNIDGLRISDIDVLRRSFKSIEEEFGGLKMNVGKLNVDIRNVEEKHVAAITEVKNTSITFGDSRLDEIQRGFFAANEGLKGRILALEDKTDDIKKNTQKNDSLFAAMIREHIQNLRVEIDSGGNEWKKDIAELRAFYTNTQNDLGALRVDFRNLEGLHANSDSLRLRLDQFLNIQSETNGRFERIDEAIDGLRKDQKKDLIILRRDFETSLADIRGHRDEVDGRVGGVYARLDSLEHDMKITLKESAIAKILSDLKYHGQEIEQTKDGLGGLLIKIKKVENDMTANHEALLGCRDEIGNFDGKVRRVFATVEEVDNKIHKYDKGIKDLWSDQKRQDEEIGILRADLIATSKSLSVLSVDIKGIGDNTALAQRVSNLQEEVTRQARVDIDLKRQIELVDDRSLKNLEKIVLLEEQNHIQKEQANYVETINTKMVELEKKQTSDVWDADIKEHRGAISILQDDMRKLLSRIEGHDGEFVLVRKDLAGFNYLKDEVRNIWESQRRQDHDIGTMEDRLKRLDINENQLKELQANLQGLLAVHSRIESLVDGQQRHDRSIVDILKQLKRMDSIDGELNNLRVSIRDLLTLKVNIEALVDQQRKIEGAFELLTADVRKKLKDWGISLEDYEERSRKLSDRLGLDINEMRGLLEVIEKRISDNRTDIKDLDAKFDLNFQKNLDIFIRNFKGGDFKELMDLVENKLYEVDRQSQKNKGHVEKLRELNSKLMVEIPSQVNKELQVLRTELSNIDGLRISDIDVLRRSFKSIEEEFGGLRGTVSKLNVDIHNVEEKHIAALTEVRNTNITISDTRIHEIEQGFVRLTEGLRDRVASLELGVEDVRKSSHKHELTLVSNINENVQMLRVDLDALGSRFKADIDKIRDVTEVYHVDIAHLKDNIKDLNKKDGRVEKVIQSLHLESAEVRNKLDEWTRLHGDVALRVGRIDDLIADAKADLRKDIFVIRKDLDSHMQGTLGLREDVDGRLGAFLLRLDTFEKELRLTTSDKTVKKILADLAIYAKDIENTKDGLGGLLAKISGVEHLIAINKEQIAKSMGDTEICQSRVSKLEATLRNIDHKVDMAESATRDLAKDQRRQDDDLAAVRSEYGRLSALDLDLRNIHEHIEITRSKFSSLEHEIDRQAKVDMNLKERVDDLDGRCISNLERIVQLEEQNHIHKEQANYVEMINTKMVEMEKQQKTEDRWGDVDAHQSSILALQGDLRKLVLRVDGHHVDIGEIRTNLSGLEKLRAALSALEVGLVDLRHESDRHRSDLKQVDMRLVQESGDRVQADANLGHRLEESSTLLGRGITTLSESIIRSFVRCYPSRKK